MKEFTSLTPVSKIQLNHQPGPHSPQPQSVSERPLERPTLVRPQRTSTVLIQNNEANQVKLSWIIRFNANWFLDLKCCSLEKVTALVIHSGIWMHVTMGSEFMEKTFQAAQLTHERCLTIDHSCKIFFWYLPNWTSNDLWCVVLYVTYSEKKIFCRSDLWLKISLVLVVQLETFSP